MVLSRWISESSLSYLGHVGRPGPFGSPVLGCEQGSCRRQGQVLGLAISVAGKATVESLEATYAAGRQAHVPLLAGWNRDEFSFQSRGRIDQAEGWTNIQALQISRYGQQKIAETAVEYLLGATDSVRQRFALQQSEQRDQSLRDEAHSIADRVRSTLLRFGWDINWSGAGTISSILKRWSSVYQHITSLDGWPTSGRTATDECPIFADVYTILAPTPVHLPLLGYLILKR